MNEKEWDKLLTRVSKQLYEGKLKPGSISPAMVKTIAGELMGAIETGYGKSFNDEGLTGRQFETLRTLETNVYHFSGAKNWHQLREMSALLGDKKGGVKTFQEFLNDVRAVDSTYNKVYLAAEYDTALTSAQMIGKWEQFEAEKDALPYLVWRTENSGRVCPLCEPLNGLKLRLDNPWWKSNGVPRHFRCHCDIIQDDEGPEQDVSKRKIPEVHPMFRSNPGITGVAFSDKHPYFESIPEKQKKNIFIASEKLMPKRDSKTPTGFERVYTHKKSGGYVDVSLEAYKEDLDYNIKWGKVLAKNGYEVQIREHITGGGKNPELSVNGVIGDFKQPHESTVRALQSAFSSAFKQQVTFPAIVFDDVEFSVTDQVRVINNSLGMHKDGKRIYGTIDFCYLIYPKGVIQKITRAEVEKGDWKWVKKLRAVGKK